MKKSVFDYCRPEEIQDLYDRAMAEDGAFNDVTSLLTIPEQAKGQGLIRAKSDLVLSGIEVAERFFKLFDQSVSFEISKHDGDFLQTGEIAATVTGNMRCLLAVERSALNLLQHLSGIATLTKRFVDEVSGTKAKILDTRKTIPGMRNLAKYAVACGNGHNHRIGLHDAVLIKDNHAAAANGVGQAVLKARLESGKDLFIEAEVSNAKELEECIDAGANRALLDNMTTAELAHCVKLCDGRIELEASGNVNLNTVREIALTGVDYISSGALTHSAPAADLNMKITPL